jgi:hypothetical protein
MSDKRWNAWRLAAIGMGLVMATALIAGLVVANWTGPTPITALPAPVPDTTPLSRALPRRAVPGRAVPVGGLESAIATPQAIVEACNKYAARQIGRQDKASAVVKDAAMGLATLYGLSESHKHDRRYRDAYAICLRFRGVPG